MSVVLDNNTVDKFVAEQVKLGNDVRWEEWTLVFFRKSKTNAGWSKKDGAYRHDNWGFQTRVPLDSDGKWRVNHRNVKHS